MRCRLAEQPARVAILGCGQAAEQYADTLSAIPAVDVVACADLDHDRAEQLAARHSIAQVLAPQALRDGDHDSVDIVVNLTPPAQHYHLAADLLRTGAAVYNEKPLALDRDHAGSLLDHAGSIDARLGCAPDTFLGGPAQHTRRLLDAGAIGQPVAAAAALLTPGPAAWHPNPDGFYQHGAGPLLDMGPYYLTTLIHLLGPVARVTALQSTPTRTRTIGQGPRHGEEFPVTVPTHTIGALELASGPLVSVVTSFEAQATRTPHLEVYGTEATIVLPDPNFFDGALLLCRAGASGWTQLPAPSPSGAGRGLGVVDLAHALLAGTPNRCSGALGRHVLDVMLALDQAATQGTTVAVASRVDRPAPMPQSTEPDACLWCTEPIVAGQTRPLNDPVSGSTPTAHATESLDA